jgi:hypothetical protein
VAYNKSKTKGNNFEKEMSKQFSQWWAGDTKSLYRSVGSGSRKSTEMYGGDIIPVSDKAKPWPFCVELKKVEKWSIENFILGKPGEPLVDFMCQCIGAAEKAENYIPLLVCAKNHKNPIIFISVREFREACHCKPKPACHMRLRMGVLRISEKLVSRHHIKYDLDFMATPLASFFQMFSRKDF